MVYLIKYYFNDEGLFCQLFSLRKALLFYFSVWTSLICYH